MDSRAQPRRATLPRHGVWWLVIVAVLLAIGLTKNINLLALLGYFLLAVFLLNAYVAGRRLRQVRVHRVLAGPVFAATPALLELRLTNPGRKALLGLQVDEKGPEHALTSHVAELGPG